MEVVGEEELRKVWKVVAGRPAIVVAHGPSLLDAEAMVLPDYNVLWTSINWFGPAERFLKRRFEIVWCASLPFIRGESIGQERKPLLSEFLERPSVCLATRPSGYDAIKSLGVDLETNPERIAQFRCDENCLRKESAFELWDPVSWPVPSIVALCLLLIAAGAPKVAIVGADGTRSSREKIYFDEEERHSQTDGLSIDQDAQAVNSGWESLSERFCSGPEFVSGKIVNANPGSALMCWPKMPLEEALGWLEE